MNDKITKLLDEMEPQAFVSGDRPMQRLIAAMRRALECFNVEFPTTRVLECEQDILKILKGDCSAKATQSYEAGGEVG